MLFQNEREKRVHLAFLTRKTQSHPKCTLCRIPIVHLDLHLYDPRAIEDENGFCLYIFYPRSCLACLTSANLPQDNPLASKELAPLASQYMYLRLWGDHNGLNATSQRRTLFWIYRAAIAQGVSLAINARDSIAFFSLNANLSRAIDAIWPAHGPLPMKGTIHRGQTFRHPHQRLLISRQRATFAPAPPDRRSGVLRAFSALRKRQLQPAGSRRG